VARRKDNLKFRYGITEEDYNLMLENQNNCCAICKKESDIKLSVDHCHQSGAVRGLLCKKCNLGLGYFKDDTTTIKEAIKYLNKSKGPGTNLGAFNATVEDYVLNKRSYIPSDMKSPAS
jgi:hypothetical protein